MRPTILLVLLLTLISVASAQRTERASDEELDGITARGRALAAYDVAAWHAGDAVNALHPSGNDAQLYVARKTAVGWEVAFGHLTEERDGFMIAYLATQGKDSATFTVRKLTPQRKDTGWTLAAANALRTAMSAEGHHDRPYNVSVLPAVAGQFYVYLVPAQTEATVFPLGGDTRYLLSSDGRTIVEKRRLHNSIIEFSTKDSKDEKIESGYHTAVLDEVPEDTDVFYVLARTPHVKEWVLTPTYVYIIHPDGEARYVTTKEVFLKAK